MGRRQKKENDVGRRQKKENVAGRRKITHLHSWEEFPNSEEVAQDVHVDLQDYFTFELLYFCTFAQLLEKETGLREWNTFLGVFEKRMIHHSFPTGVVAIAKILNRSIILPSKFWKQIIRSHQNCFFPTCR